MGDRKAQQQRFTDFGRGSLVLWTGGVTAFGICKSTWPQNAKLGENIDKFPLAPSKKEMRYVFVSTIAPFPTVFMTPKGQKRQTGSSMVT